MPGRSGVRFFHPIQTVNNITIINEERKYNVYGGNCWYGGRWLYSIMALSAWVPFFTKSVSNVILAANNKPKNDSFYPGLSLGNTQNNKFTGLERRFGDNYTFTEKDGKYIAKPKGGGDEVSSTSLTELYDTLLEKDKASKAEEQDNESGDKKTVTDADADAEEKENKKDETYMGAE